MFPFLLAQLEHLFDVDQLRHLLGGSITAVAGALIVRQYISSRLEKLKMLEKRAERDKLRWTLLRRQHRELVETLNRYGRNAHALSQVTQGVVVLATELAELAQIKVDIPRMPGWEPAQLSSSLQLKFDEEEEEDENAEGENDAG